MTDSTTLRPTLSLLDLLIALEKAGVGEITTDGSDLYLHSMRPLSAELAAEIMARKTDLCQRVPRRPAPRPPPPGFLQEFKK